MNLKKDKILSVIIIFVLCFLFHFLYELLPLKIIAILAPVNESIWEHMKIIFSSIIFYGIIDYIILKKNNIKFNNFFLNLFITAFISIPIYLIIYLPIYHFLKDNMIVNIGLLFIVIVISQIISFYILKSKEKNLNMISIIFIIIMYIVFGYLTYHPKHNYLFFDTKNKQYGINNYNIK